MGGSWFVYDFECANEPMVSRLCEWFERNHPVEFPVDEYHVFGELTVEGGETRGADYAWIGNYLYLTCRVQRPTLLRETADRWDRAVAAHVDATTETVKEAALVGKDEDGDPETIKAYQGKDGWAGNGLEVVFARDHGFRFRTYSAASPTDQVTPHPGAFDHFYGRFDDPEAVLEAVAAESSLGVDADTRAFLRDDPATEPRYPDPDEIDDRGGDSDGNRIAIQDERVHEAIQEAIESDDADAKRAIADAVAAGREDGTVEERIREVLVEGQSRDLTGGSAGQADRERGSEGADGRTSGSDESRDRTAVSSEQTGRTAGSNRFQGRTDGAGRNARLQGTGPNGREAAGQGGNPRSVGRAHPGAEPGATGAESGDTRAESGATGADQPDLWSRGSEDEPDDGVDVDADELRDWLQSLFRDDERPR